MRGDGVERSFGNTLSELRHSRYLSQRELAGDLHISQALLSHYENGTREPGLPFVCRVCDYFGVSADYILGRSSDEDSGVCGTFALAELNKTLSKTSDANVREAALSYIDCAAKRIGSRLASVSDDLYLAEQSSAMADAELSVVRALSLLRKIKRD
ncbi:MAG: XRE family transcriptional regulator [Clostridia bacterium]|nr:XRE family transcriptional regulator [Clostridia bacterium]